MSSFSRIEKGPVNKTLQDRSGSLQVIQGNEFVKGMGHFVAARSENNHFAAASLDQPGQVLGVTARQVTNRAGIGVEFVAHTGQECLGERPTARRVEPV